MNTYLIYLSNTNKLSKEELLGKVVNIELLRPLLIKTNKRVKLNSDLILNKSKFLDRILSDPKKQSFVIKDKSVLGIDDQELTKRISSFKIVKDDFISIERFENEQSLQESIDKVDLMYFFFKLGITFYEKFCSEVKVHNTNCYGIKLILDNLEYCITSRKFINQIDFYTFDEKGTIENDDAIGFAKLQNGYEIYVAIADLSEVWNIYLDRLTLEFPQSIYTIDSKFYMLPRDFIEMLSLRENRNRPAWVFILKVDKNFDIKDYYFEPTIVNVRKNFTYSQGNKILKQNEFMYKIAFNLLKKRLNNGAIYFQDIGGMKFIIQELMIFINYVCAKILHKDGIPYISRTITIPTELKNELKKYAGRIYDLRDRDSKIMFYRVLNLLSYARYDVGNYRHEILGLDRYTHVTSPLRRYVDVINQKQLISFYYNFDEFFTYEELKDILGIINPLLQRYNICTRNYNKVQKLISYVDKLLNSNSQEVQFPYYILCEDVFIILEEIKQEINVGKVFFLKNRIVNQDTLILSKNYVIEVIMNEIRRIERELEGGE
ncbi:MAG: RNB domain-containing ribonuclease [bacterium]